MIRTNGELMEEANLFNVFVPCCGNGGRDKRENFARGVNG